MGEGVFYDDERGAPEEGADDQGEVGFEGGGLGGCGWRIDGESTLRARLRMSGRLAGDGRGCNGLRKRNSRITQTGAVFTSWQAGAQQCCARTQSLCGMRWGARREKRRRDASATLKEKAGRAWGPSRFSVVVVCFFSLVEIDRANGIDHARVKIDSARPM